MNSWVIGLIVACLTSVMLGAMFASYLSTAGDLKEAFDLVQNISSGLIGFMSAKIVDKIKEKLPEPNGTN